MPSIGSTCSTSWSGPGRPPWWLAPFELLTDARRRCCESSPAAVGGALAAQWVVSEATMRSHVRSILGKLAVPSQLAAVAAAVESGWV